MALFRAAKNILKTFTEHFKINTKTKLAALDINNGIEKKGKCVARH